MRKILLATALLFSTLLLKAQIATVTPVNVPMDTILMSDHYSMRGDTSEQFVDYKQATYIHLKALPDGNVFVNITRIIDSVNINILVDSLTSQQMGSDGYYNFLHAFVTSVTPQQEITFAAKYTFDLILDSYAVIRKKGEDGNYSMIIYFITRNPIESGSN